MGNLLRIQLIRKAGGVRRCHTERIIHQQTVSEHSWGVASLILELWPDCSMELLRAGLYHDVGEVWTGDIPANFKKQNPWLSKHLGEAEEEYIESALGLDVRMQSGDAARLKAVDLLEFMLFCVDERRLGNRNLASAFERARIYLEDSISALLEADRDRIVQLSRDIVEAYREIGVQRTPINQMLIGAER